MKKRLHQIELFVKYPHDVQEEWMHKLIAGAKDTEFGKRHHFSAINNYEQFKRNIPLQDYESLKPAIELTRRGAQNLLWPGEIKWFAKSSGTTDKSKFIPVSSESLDGCHYNAGRDMVTLHCVNNPETLLFTGKNLALGGSYKTDVFGNHNSFHGDVSAIIIQNLPMWAEFFRAPDVNIALMDEWESKLQKMAESMMDENVTSLAGVPSWMLVLLKKVLHLKNVKTIHEVWPNLEVYFHGGVSFTPYKEQFRQLFDNDKINYIQLYSASEGFFGIQDLQGREDMLLMLDYGIFYEFIPAEDIGLEDPRVYNLSEVKTGINYAMVITTNAGLWRYQVGDTVQFTDTNPYRIIVSGRTKHYINVFGEEVMVHNTDQAVAKACEKTNAMVADYTVAPVYMNETSGSHEWLIEFEKEPDNFDNFVMELDSSLKQLNSDYEAKRYNDYVLKSPIVKLLPKGSFYNWLKSNNRLGGQFKVPRLNNGREFVDSISKSALCQNI
jgi:phenylacetate-coenzyme A ligase PaaK-like adenylate-forming protein